MKVRRRNNGPSGGRSVILKAYEIAKDGGAFKSAKVYPPDVEELRKRVLGRVIFLFSVQLLLCVLILVEAVKNYGSKTTYVVEW